MFDLLLILLGTFLVCASAGFIWSRYERNRSAIPPFAASIQDEQGQEWIDEVLKQLEDDESPYDTYPPEYHDRLNGRRQIARGHTREQERRLADRLGIPHGTPNENDPLGQMKGPS